jgi:hypothetical protein
MRLIQSRGIDLAPVRTSTAPRFFIPDFAKNILLLHAGINALLSGFAWCKDAELDQRSKRSEQGNRKMPS